MAKTVELGRGIIVEPERVGELYDIMREAGACFPAFCTENSWSTIAAIMAAAEMAEELGLACIPLVISATGHYEPREQLPGYRPEKVGDGSDPAIFGLDSLIWDVDNAVGKVSRKVLVMVHLDHAHPENDRQLIEYGLVNGFFSSIMYDCSHLRFEENIRLTKKFVGENRDKVLVEGIVDQIYEAGTGDIVNKLTEVADAVRYLEEVQPAFMVANLGTEHRSTLDDYKPEYHGERARELTKALGKKMLVLHGTSCLGEEKLANLKDDGIIRVNVWTRLERMGARAIGEYVDGNREKVLVRQDLSYFPVNNIRAAWLRKVKEVMKEYMWAFGYEGLKGYVQKLGQFGG